MGDTACGVGAHVFPRDWPDVYNDSDALRSLLRKKGPCAGKRVSSVPNPGPEERDTVSGLDLRWLQSCANAEAVKSKLGLAIVEGWAIYDLLEDVTGGLSWLSDIGG